MSADNWTVCPKCKTEIFDKRQKNWETLHKAYGKIPEAEYRTRHADLSVLDREPFPEELREDYEIGINEDGLFFVSYSSGCSRCKFEFKHKFQQQVK